MKQTMETAFEGTCIWNLKDRDFKAAIINMFKDLEEIILELKKDIVLVTHQMGTIFKEIEVTKKKRTKCRWDTKSTSNKSKNR